MTVIKVALHVTEYMPDVIVFLECLHATSIVRKDSNKTRPLVVSHEIVSLEIGSVY